jgi:hypothetical protein
MCGKLEEDLGKKVKEMLEVWREHGGRKGTCEMFVGANTAVCKGEREQQS